uniref:Uncharacterized protein n=1 Tax=Anguilla anguilla TaxID=7936 RepID=A0A0E9TTD0_ANGAN
MTTEWADLSASQTPPGFNF